MVSQYSLQDFPGWAARELVYETNTPGGLVYGHSLSAERDELVFVGRRRAYELPLYTVGRFRKRGSTHVTVQGENGSLRIEYDSEVVEPRVEAVPNGDARLATTFGKSISRCTFKLRTRSREATVRLQFVPEG